MPDPVILSRCVIEIDLEQKSLPEIKCWRDRERTVNPDLQKGMTCESRVEVFEKDGKRVHVFDRICRPEKVLRKLRHQPHDKVIRQLRELMQKNGVPPQASHGSGPTTTI
ncbi:MAG TPA: hypothetical protein VJR29_14015 [bacterium]|nr:hypothetical protein [bacterium]